MSWICFSFWESLSLYTDILVGASAKDGSIVLQFLALEKTLSGLCRHLYHKITHLRKGAYVPVKVSLSEKLVKSTLYLEKQRRHLNDVIYQVTTHVSMEENLRHLRTRCIRALNKIVMKMRSCVPWKSIEVSIAYILLWAKCLVRYWLKLEYWLQVSPTIQVHCVFCSHPTLEPSWSNVDCLRVPYSRDGECLVAREIILSAL